MIDGVKIKKLEVHSDDRGLVMEFMRDDDEIFEKFGQVYMTLVKYGIAKAWHYHKLQDDHFVCVEGKALVALYDMREDSPTYKESQDFVLSAPEIEGDHLLIKIPKGVLHGFTAYECDQAKIVNTPTQHFNYKEPDELRYKWDDPDIEYKWPKYVKKGG
ncbi:dTDP-4-dehydrorhamnose 3,5-epimerase family protein [bacterium]|jgi:dTDP-4-dehydrorhamnose 3,5-epimerase|nr:dTDP-4-dehydrorhamnose 3,5-epimerase family protein [bacterium]MBT4121913.1 dTDP-4-dehydrorhamnose 3,5-epimerase family protein [bacterium]MBT4335224.1 dTDP-4-dehydrorhamnose 3,5-epimerase family protein [bacterium]MBT4495729.1 dTDP-4-dehydrorhamnose 3,5-epimerase family protein [bacterium]MBT4764060.1 dTDP-4-dehydrorhamnose 3,5-epimerase family protein [bacterium]